MHYKNLEICRKCIGETKFNPKKLKLSFINPLVSNMPCPFEIHDETLKLLEKRKRWTGQELDVEIWKYINNLEPFELRETPKSCPYYVEHLVYKANVGFLEKFKRHLRCCEFKRLKYFIKKKIEKYVIYLVFFLEKRKT